ncbi:MAG: helix-turn-helix domain-containing protein [Deltaproteobacteria bacterium]
MPRTSKQWNQNGARNTNGDRPVIEEVGRRIRRLRTERRGGKITQSHIARKADVSVSFLSMIERGERSPSVETLGEIANALGVSLAELFLDEPERAERNPAFKKLAEFAKSRRLGRADLDRLLAVAEAIFAD